jgi:hypothetical protein
MAKQGRRGRSLICPEACAHTAAHAGGRWVSARARGVRGVGSFAGTRGSITRGVRARTIAWLDLTGPGDGPTSPSP